MDWLTRNRVYLKAVGRMSYPKGEGGEAREMVGRHVLQQLLLHDVRESR